MTQWYDDEFNDANAVDANAVEANAVDANAVEANAVDPNKYLCDCSCNLKFIEYKPGFDISVGSEWLISENAMVYYSWVNYIRSRKFNLLQDFHEHIILKYNDIRNRNNEAVKPEDAPWIHLYKQEILQNEHIPFDGILQMRTVFVGLSH